MCRLVGAGGLNASGTEPTEPVNVTTTLRLGIPREKSRLSVHRLRPERGCSGLVTPHEPPTGKPVDAERSQFLSSSYSQNVQEWVNGTTKARGGTPNRRDLKYQGILTCFGYKFANSIEEVYAETPIKKRSRRLGSVRVLQYVTAKVKSNEKSAHSLVMPIA
jgi:hypothetical protein